MSSLFWWNTWFSVCNFWLPYFLLSWEDFFSRISFCLVSSGETKSGSTGFCSVSALALALEAAAYSFGLVILATAGSSSFFELRILSTEVFSFLLSCLSVSCKVLASLGLSALVFDLWEVVSSLLTYSLSFSSVSASCFRAWISFSISFNEPYDWIKVESFFWDLD